jgi:hypothetical protein
LVIVYTADATLVARKADDDLARNWSARCAPRGSAAFQ